MATVAGGYGAGRVPGCQRAMHIELRDQITKLRDEKGMNIVLTAHYAVKEVKDPAAIASYHAFEIKCHEKVSSMWREWADIVGFARFETAIKEGEGGDKTIARGTGERVVQFCKQPSQQAKNCYDLPPEVKFSKTLWDEIQVVIKSKSPKQLDELSLEYVKKHIQVLYEELTDQKTKDIVKKTIDDAGTDDKKLRNIFKRLKEIRKAA